LKSQARLFSCHLSLPPPSPASPKFDQFLGLKKRHKKFSELLLMLMERGWGRGVAQGFPEMRLMQS